MEGSEIRSCTDCPSHLLFLDFCPSHFTLLILSSLLIMTSSFSSGRGNRISPVSVCCFSHSLEVNAGDKIILGAGVKNDDVFG